MHIQMPCNQLCDIATGCNITQFQRCVACPWVAYGHMQHYIAVNVLYMLLNVLLPLVNIT